MITQKADELYNPVLLLCYLLYYVYYTMLHYTMLYYTILYNADK